MCRSANTTIKNHRFLPSVVKALLPQPHSSSSASSSSSSASSVVSTSGSSTCSSGTTTGNDPSNSGHINNGRQQLEEEIPLTLSSSSSSWQQRQRQRQRQPSVAAPPAPAAKKVARTSSGGSGSGSGSSSSRCQRGNKKFQCLTVVHQYHDHANDDVLVAVQSAADHPDMDHDDEDPENDTRNNNDDNCFGCFSEEKNEYSHARIGSSSSGATKVSRMSGGSSRTNHHHTTSSSSSSNTIPFVMKLYRTLQWVERDGYDHIVSWQPHGRCFVIRDPDQFAAVVLPYYFQLTKISSFQRQLNLYGFKRLTTGNDRSGYYHELFLRGRADLIPTIKRVKVKGTHIRAKSNPIDEPNFWNGTYPWVGVNGTGNNGNNGNNGGGCPTTSSPSSGPVPSPPGSVRTTTTPVSSSLDRGLVTLSTAPPSLSLSSSYYNNGNSNNNDTVLVVSSSPSPSNPTSSPADPEEWSDSTSSSSLFGRRRLEHGSIHPWWFLDRSRPFPTPSMEERPSGVSRTGPTPWCTDCFNHHHNKNGNNQTTTTTTTMGADDHNNADPADDADRVLLDLLNSSFTELLQEVEAALDYDPWGHKGPILEMIDNDDEDMDDTATPPMVVSPLSSSSLMEVAEHNDDSGIVTTPCATTTNTARTVATTTAEATTPANGGAQADYVCHDDSDSDSHYNLLATFDDEDDADEDDESYDRSNVVSQSQFDQAESDLLRRLCWMEEDDLIC